MPDIHSTMVSRLVPLACAVLATSAHRVGPGKDMFARFAARRGAAGLSGAGGVVSMETPEHSYEVEVSDSSADEGGAYMAANGFVRGVADSDFMMKGTEGDLYGWMVLGDEDKAYEYTTDASGTIEVAEVPVSKVRTRCEFHEHSGADGPTARAAEPLDAHVGNYNGEDIRKLQSLPGAKVVLLLDIDTYFSDKSKSDAVRKWSRRYFYENWQAVAAGFSMFELNVVTDWDAYRQASIRNRGKACYIDDTKQSYGFFNTIGSNRCGSYNYNHFGDAYTGFRLGRVSLHEAGHMFGLRHKGTPTSEYHGGIRTYLWGPVMGNQWMGNYWGASQVLQWSKGEYRDANSKQDDLRQIGRYVARRADDITGTRGLMIVGGRVSVSQNTGKITDRTDSDAWTFTVGGGGGRVELVIDRTEFLGGSMLDVDATLQDSAGRVLQRSNVRKSRRAVIRTDVAAGAYTLVVRGGAEGTPEWGFSNYGSLGNYGISGTVAGGGSGTGSSTPPPPTPPPGRCVDLQLPNGAEFMMREYESNYGCAWFVQSSTAYRCEQYGGDEWANADFGTTARAACCVCGGGSTGTTPPPRTLPPFTSRPATPPATLVPGPCSDRMTTDGMAWHLSQGARFDCRYFGGDVSRCTKFGGEGYRSMGLTAQEACCVCGGGVDTSTVVPSTPTPTTVTPRTPLPTTAVPPTPVPSTTAPATEAPRTSSPNTAFPLTPTPTPTEEPPTPAPATPEPVSPQTPVPGGACTDKTRRDGSAYYIQAFTSYTCKGYFAKSPLRTADRCTRFGGAEYADDEGTTAQEACCACGGGQ